MRLLATRRDAGRALAALALVGIGLPRGAVAVLAMVKAERIVVVKGERRLHLLRDGATMRTYRIALGFEPRGTKLFQGDGRTPEGVYHVTAFNPSSRFHRSIRISYPNEQDRVRARSLGRSPGGDIMIHGMAPERREYGAGHWQFNWTNGCIAVTDREIDEIWHRVAIGTPIEIRP